MVDIKIENFVNQVGYQTGVDYISTVSKLENNVYDLTFLNQRPDLPTLKDLEYIANKIAYNLPMTSLTLFKRDTSTQLSNVLYSCADSESQKLFFIMICLYEEATIKRFDIPEVFFEIKNYEISIYDLTDKMRNKKKERSLKDNDNDIYLGFLHLTHSFQNALVEMKVITNQLSASLYKEIHK